MHNHCFACKHTEFSTIYKEDMPLCTLGFPETEEQALKLKKFKLDFVRCLNCGHIFNKNFSYKEVPYHKNANKMYNNAPIWSEFIKSILELVNEEIKCATNILEIGYGEGQFLNHLAKSNSEKEFFGFDPSGARDLNLPNIKLHNEYFIPEIHFKSIKSDFLIARHILEHLENPIDFLNVINQEASKNSLKISMYIEVPCVDNLLSSLRTVDLYYEHCSQFTTLSFLTMISKAGFEIIHLDHGYNKEIVFAIISNSKIHKQNSFLRQSEKYYRINDSAKNTIRQDLDHLSNNSNKNIIIWGGTGKSAAFLNRYNLRKEKFPIVIDSDENKSGTYVPGTGQLIQNSKSIKGQAFRYIVIPTQWRLKDILLEISKLKIQYEAIYTEHNGELIEVSESTI